MYIHTYVRMYVLCSTRDCRGIRRMLRLPMQSLGFAAVCCVHTGMACIFSTCRGATHPVGGGGGDAADGSLRVL